jgi:RNA polymerase sigma factor (TIGR02999 family)
MESTTRSEITRFLRALDGDAASRFKATTPVFELLYGELRTLAATLLRRERPDHTLDPTALVHEAYARLVVQEDIEWQGRAHVLGVAAHAMRRVLIDHARRRARQKRGGSRERVTLSDVPGVLGRDLELIELDDALDKLAEASVRAAKVVELKVFAGLSGEEIAEVLGVSRRTVVGDWTMARLWLAREFNA